jgi:hypothetical protein
MPLSPRVKDHLRLLLVALGVAIVVLIFIWASLVLVPGQYREQMNWKWTRFAVVTVFFVFYCLKTYWRARRHVLFWILLLGILAVHILGVGSLFFQGAGLPLLFFAPTVALEWALLAFAVYHFLGIGPPAGGPR